MQVARLRQPPAADWPKYTVQHVVEQTIYDYRSARALGRLVASENVRRSAAGPCILVTMDLERDICYRALQARDARFDGRFFTGVTSTGVYCRPVCPARTPRLENCAFFACAAAAEAAGFRPCLRCRPETAPGTPAWLGTSATVTRALRLIDGGALDDGGVDDLAARLGVGARHLRRLFACQLGVSPRAVALTRRVHLARQLLEQTSLAGRGGRALGRLRERAPVARRVRRPLRTLAAGRPPRARASPPRATGSRCGSATGRRWRGTRCSRTSRRARFPEWRWLPMVCYRRSIRVAIDDRRPRGHPRSAPAASGPAGADGRWRRTSRCWPRARGRCSISTPIPD